MQRHLTLLVALVLAAGTIRAADAPLHAPLVLTAPVQDKNFYFLSLVERDRSIAKAVEADPVLRAVRQRKIDALHKCTADVECFMTAMRFDESEIAETADVLRKLVKTDDLRRSGAYVRFEDDLAGRAWIDAAHGINHIIDVYGSGKPPRYPKIDAMAFDVKSDSYGQLIQTLAANLDEQLGDAKLFFQPSLRFAMDLLQINHRDEAGRLEPLELGENAAAMKRIPKIHWQDFPYSVIVVPGSGPDRTTWALSPHGRLRIEIAARRFREHKAPLIMVSGGYVHPEGTPYNEAIEMKKSLIRDYGIPADAILVEPHARHTTTNLRNAARLMYRDGIPFDRKALATTDAFQSTYIEGESFAKRCSEELGYQPITVIGRISIFDLAFTPRLDSLQIDPMDPLDP